MARSTASWMARPLPTLERLHRTYGDTFTFRIAHEGTWVFVSHPDAVKQVFTGDPRLLHAGEGNMILLPVVGPNSLLLIDEDRHMGQRKLLLPPFHGKRLQRYEQMMGEVATAELERWPQDTPLRMDKPMQAVTLEVIMRAVFGVGVGSRHERLGGLLRKMIAEVNGPGGFGAPFLLGPRAAARILRRRMRPVDEEIAALVADRRRDPHLDQREDILSMLVQARHEDGSPMSGEELRDELITLLVAGHETTATALAWTFERLVHNPAALTRLREELDAGEDDSYLDAVIQETLRLRPVIGLVVRRLQAPVEIAGYELPAGVTVAPCIHLMHRRPEIYPDPHAFRPERFLEQAPSTYTWIPFGGGVRRCIGASFAQLEMKAVLRAVLSRLDVSAADPAPEPFSRRLITNIPARGGTIVVHRREAPAATPAVGGEVEAVAAESAT